MCIDGEIFFLRNAGTHTCTSTHISEHIMYAHPISMSASERLIRLDLEIYKIGHQKCLTVDGDIDYH
jgi:hypothetical protein